MAITPLLIRVRGIEIPPGAVGYERIPQAPDVYVVEESTPVWCAIRRIDGRVFHIGWAWGVEHLTHESIGGSSARQRIPAERFQIEEPNHPLHGKEREEWLAWNYSRE
ncbi:MAG: hypothetical protein HY341_02685 [Candidatus Kerfeldbacteria bacterium]|nr:hypothetical protein [Candidatus Kerfeldbacteria bacterium]